MAHFYVDLRDPDRAHSRVVGPPGQLPSGASLPDDPLRSDSPSLENPDGLENPDWAIAVLDGSAFALWGSALQTLRPQRVEPERVRANKAQSIGARNNERGMRRMARAATARDLDDSPLVMRSRDAEGAEHWIVVHTPGSGLRVNGVPLTTGARVLRHRDELRLAGVPGRTWFSLERRCEIAPFDGPPGSICPRCKQEIERESRSVRCPLCRVYYHESEEFPCWTYAPTCAFDEQTTDRHAGFRWTPAELERDA